MDKNKFFKKNGLRPSEEQRLGSIEVRMRPIFETSYAPLQEIVNRLISNLLSLFTH